MRANSVSREVDFGSSASGAAGREIGRLTGSCGLFGRTGDGCKKVLAVRGPIGFSDTKRALDDMIPVFVMSIILLIRDQVDFMISSKPWRSFNAVDSFSIASANLRASARARRLSKARLTETTVRSGVLGSPSHSGVGQRRRGMVIGSFGFEVGLF